MGQSDPALAAAAASSVDEQLALPTLHLDTVRTALDGLLAASEDPTEVGALSEAVSAIEQVWSLFDLIPSSPQVLFLALPRIIPVSI